MKTFKLSVLSCLVLMFFCTSTNLTAQKIVKKDSDGKTMIIIKKGNGDETVMTSEDLDEMLIDLNIEIDGDTERFMKGHVNGHRNHRYTHKTTKAFLGIYSSSHDDGIQISKVVSNSAAERGGLQADDVITSINGYNVRNVVDLQNNMKSHKPGDVVDIRYNRGEKKYKLSVELGQKTVRTSYRSNRYEVDPCAIFIGVYTNSNYREKGVTVVGVIDDTPAMEANLLKGDVITAIDDVPVRSHLELKVERDKHSQGDAFEVSYIRDGVAQKVTAYFKDCREEERVQEQPVEIVEEVVEEAAPIAPVVIPTTNNTLALEDLSAYPNPTYGNVKLNFQAEAKPTTIRIVDVTGRVIYNESLNNFDGFYNRDLDVSHATAGVLTISIQQGEKVFTKNIILLSRA